MESRNFFDPNHAQRAQFRAECRRDAEAMFAQEKRRRAILGNVAFGLGVFASAFLVFVFVF